MTYMDMYITWLRRTDNKTTTKHTRKGGYFWLELNVWLRTHRHSYQSPIFDLTVILHWAIKGSNLTKAWNRLQHAVIVNSYWLLEVNGHWRSMSVITGVHLQCSWRLHSSSVRSQECYCSIICVPITWQQIQKSTEMTEIDIYLFICYGHVLLIRINFNHSTGTYYHTQWRMRDEITYQFTFIDCCATEVCE